LGGAGGFFRRAWASQLLCVGRMHISRFVLTYTDVRPGEHVLYDVIGDQYVGVDDTTLAAARRWQTEGPRDAGEREAQRALIECGILVESAGDDDARLRGFLERASEGMPGTMYVTLMPTLACNLACDYCFQKDHPAFNRATRATEESTAEWVLRKVDDAATPKLVVHYFGGEPLTRKDYVLRTAVIFSAAMRARGGSFSWELTTNGIGLDPDFVRTMRGFGEGAIKVTLDGDKETHDAARVYRGGKPTFDEILGKLVAVARAKTGVRLWLGGNFKPDQVASYQRLILRLKSLKLDGAFDAVRFKPIVDTDDASTGSCTNCASGTSQSDAVQVLSRAVDASGLATHGGQHQVPNGPCELHWKNSYIVDPDGYVYKCPAVAGRSDMAVASVTKPGERAAPLLELRPWEKCGDCPFLPVCVGGCLGGKFLQTGRMDEVFCRRTEFEVAFKAEIAARYLTEFGEDEQAA
jgi:uncharacterized protein